MNPDFKANPEEEYKYITPDPDMHNQDEDPGVPLDSGICQHCGQPKDQHHAKGALEKLDISNNNIKQGEALQRITELCHTKAIELDNHESESDDDDDYRVSVKRHGHQQGDVLLI